MEDNFSLKGQFTSVNVILRKSLQFWFSILLCLFALCLICLFVDLSIFQIAFLSNCLFLSICLFVYLSPWLFFDLFFVSLYNWIFDFFLLVYFPLFLFCLLLCFFFFFFFCFFFCFLFVNLTFVHLSLCVFVYFLSSCLFVINSTNQLNPFRIDV